LAVTAVATIASYIYTLPSVKPYLYEAKYELRAKNVRSIGFIDIDYVVNSVRYDENFRQSIISKAGEDSKLTENNYSKRILITNDTKTTLSAKGESKEEATRLADILYQSKTQRTHTVKVLTSWTATTMSLPVKTNPILLTLLLQCLPMATTSRMGVLNHDTRQSLCHKIAD
jgi:hypothetical protein